MSDLQKRNAAAMGQAISQHSTRLAELDAKVIDLQRQMSEVIAEQTRLRAELPKLVQFVGTGPTAV